MNMIDIMVLASIIISAFIGFKKGFFSQAVSLIGFIIIIVLSFTFKDNLADFFFRFLPLIKIGDSQVLMVLLYELVAFALIFTVLGTILKIILVATNMFESLLKFTIILGIPSKIFGALFGAVEGYLIAFIVLTLLNQPIVSYNTINNSFFGGKMLKYTPIISEKTKGINTAVKDLVTLKDEYEVTENKNEYDLKALNVLLKNKIVKVSSIDILVKNRKLQIDNIENVLGDYR